MGKLLTAFFKKMSLQQAWEGDFDHLSEVGMPQEQLEHFIAICENVPDGPKNIYDFLSEKDPLFRDIYGTGTLNGQEEEIFVFPFVEEMKTVPEGIKEVVGPIGTQTSKYHAETLRQHVSMVAANLVAAGVDKDLAVNLAVLHDVGKKYTPATNKVGEVCFYRHGELSAFMAGHWLRRQNLDEETAKMVVAVVYGHMLPTTAWADSDKNRTKFYEQLCEFGGSSDFADRAMQLIEKISAADEGAEKLTPEILAKIARGYSLICD